MISLTPLQLRPDLAAILPMVKPSPSQAPRPCADASPRGILAELAPLRRQ